MKIIVTIQKPPTSQPSTIDRWYKTLKTCEILAKQMGVPDTSKPSEGVWLLSQESQLPMLQIVVSLAGQEKFSYQVEFDGKPDKWKYEYPKLPGQ